MARAVAYKVVGGWVVADNDLTPRQFLSDPAWDIYYQYPTLSAWSNTSTIGVTADYTHSDPYQPWNRRIESWELDRPLWWAKIGSRGVYEYEVSDVYYETYHRYPIFTGPTPPGY